LTTTGLLIRKESGGVIMLMTSIASRFYIYAAHIPNESFIKVKEFMNE